MMEASRGANRNLPAERVRLAAQLILTVIDPPDPGVLRPELAGEPHDPVPRLGGRHFWSTARGGMIERPRLVIEIRAQVPEILQDHFAVELGEQDLAIAAVIVFAERAERGIVVLEPRPGLRLTVDQPAKPIPAIAIAKPPHIVRVVRR